VTFDLKSAEALVWDYFVDGRRQIEESTALRWAASPNPQERLDPGVVWAYHDPHHAVSELRTELVDSYRCWPRATVSRELLSNIEADGIRQPLVIYSNGSHGVLGEGNHRLQAAFELGLGHVPVVVVPDRLVLPEGMDAQHLRPLDPTVSLMTAMVARLHWTTGGHALSTITVGPTVHAFCSCGAQWKRPKGS